MSKSARSWTNMLVMNQKYLYRQKWTIMFTDRYLPVWNALVWIRVVSGSWYHPYSYPGFVPACPGNLHWNHMRSDFEKIRPGKFYKYDPRQNDAAGVGSDAWSWRDSNPHETPTWDPVWNLCEKSCAKIKSWRSYSNFTTQIPPLSDPPL